MKSTTRLFLPFGLVAVLLAAACAPAVPSPTPELPPATFTQSAAPTQPEASAEPSQAAQPEATVTLVPTVTAFPVATSRGPELEASDPTLVTLAAGQLQLVEFFRFT